MRLDIRTLSTSVVALAAAGCAMTGDWNQDSIFFSRELADERLAAERAHVSRLEAELADLEVEIERLQHVVDRARIVLKSRGRELVQYQQRIRRLSGRLEVLQRQVAQEGAADAQLTRRQAEARREITDLEREIGDLRRDLLILLDNA